MLSEFIQLLICSTSPTPAFIAGVNLLCSARRFVDVKRRWVGHVHHTGSLHQAASAYHF